jgi:hypothetical protein
LARFGVVASASALSYISIEPSKWPSLKRATSASTAPEVGPSTQRTSTESPIEKLSDVTRLMAGNTETRRISSSPALRRSTAGHLVSVVVVSMKQLYSD